MTPVIAITISEQICRTLNDDTPANAGDLVALVMDRLLRTR